MRLQRLNPGYVDPPTSGAFTLSKAIHDGKILRLSQLAGHTITLPPALGMGTLIRAICTIAPTSNSNIMKVANALDIFIGALSAAAVTFAATDQSAFQANGTTFDTITLNRTTTGGALRGEWFEFKDVGTGLWHVAGMIIASATPATPFSATVA